LSPAKHTRTALARRPGPSRPSIPKEGCGEGEGGGSGRGLDKGFGFNKGFAAKAKVICSFRNALLWHLVLMCNMANLKTPHTHAVFLEIFLTMWKVLGGVDLLIAVLRILISNKIFIGFMVTLLYGSVLHSGLQTLCFMPMTL
jgi:hypothetical protein